ncbi:hypothetical protein BLNAU_19428 [Blattamonas nauphoetae]|uniref:FERM domain-containing protein n=1 Tax=Blattamonas nauphoetae TaxID=2049346 RepID=A0ABQ9X1G1_9EUKA|nr:hypothetical protein BLNAU_19428 [Blattamonas nauphoetae]
MTIIEIHFCDKSVKKLVASEETTVKDLLQKIEQKMALTVDLDSFALYEETTVNGLVIDKYLKPDDLCPKLPAGSKFMFKKRFFFEDNSANADVTHMEFLQLRDDVILGHYVLGEREFLELAAIDMRVTYGNPDTNKHKPGFLVDADLLAKYIPAPFLKQRKPKEWEKLILDEFQRIAFDPIDTDFEGKLRYIEKLKEFCEDYFGAVFFEATELILVDKVVRDHIPVLLAVNKVGIHTFKKPTPKSKDVTQNMLIRTNTFQEILGWAVHPPTKTFIYTVPSDSEEGLKFTFESEVAAEMPDLCQSYVQLIIQSSNPQDGEGEATDE